MSLIELYLFLACCVIFHAFVVDCFFLKKISFSKHSFRNTNISLSNNLGPDQDQYVGPDLGSNSLQRYLQMTSRH